MSSDAKTQESRPFWQRDRKQSIERTVQAIQEISDPNSKADEMLLWMKVVLIVLLLFSGALGAISYFKNFSSSFPYWVALLGAAGLTFVIEFGKSYATKWAIRTPFFYGMKATFRSSAETTMFVGLLLMSIGTFWVSAYNSTIGSKQLALLLTQERDTTGTFVPNTSDIDSLIASTQANIDAARATKWQGTTTRPSQATISEAQATITTLSAQRETTIAQQRKDWEKQQTRKGKNSEFAASLVLAAGGFVEFIQFIVMLIIVACEVVLLRRMSSAPTPSPDAAIGYRRAATPTTALPSYSDQPPTPPEPPTTPRRPIGFLRDREVDLPEARVAVPEQPTVPAKIIVEQREQAEQPVPSTPETAAILADVREWKKRCTQCFHRACNQQREEFRRANRLRTTCYATMLEAIGFRCSIIFDTLYIQIQEPSAYNISEQAIQTIQEQKLILEQIGKEGRA